VYLNALSTRTARAAAPDVLRPPATPRQKAEPKICTATEPTGLPPSGDKRQARSDAFSAPRALPSLSTAFPLTGFGHGGVNGWRVAAARWVHGRSALVASGVALTSPTLRRVGRQNREHLTRAPQGDTPRDILLSRLSPSLLDAIRDQVLEHLDDAFLTNLRRHIRKAGGRVRQSLRPDGGELTRTRAQLVAEMIDLGRPASALNRALERLAPALLARRPFAAMGPLERDDALLKIAAETFDCLMQPTAEQAHRTAMLVAELGAQGQEAFDRIHTQALRDLLQALAALPEGSTTEAMSRLAQRHAARTSKRIERSRTQLFDTFRRRNAGQFGYHCLSEQVRENSNLEYYRSLTLPSALWGTGARVLTAALALGGGGVGVALSVTMTAVLQYVTAVTAQASAGATGAASADLKPFDSALVPRAIIDPEVYADQRHLAATVQRIGQQALEAYTQPGNPAALACRRTVQRLERLGYDQAARQALAPELYALCDYQAHMLGIDSAGLDQAVPPPVRIAALLHAFVDSLPALPPELLQRPDDAIRTVVQQLVEAIDHRSTQVPPADSATIAARTHEHARALMRHAGMDRQALGALLAPDAAALHAGGVDFIALVHTLLQSSALMEQALFQSRGLLRAQYRGLYVNAAVGLAVQLVIGVAAVFGIGAATAAGTPAGGFAAAVGFAALSLAASAISRDAGAVAWYRQDIRSQTDAHLYREMRSPLARPVAGDPDQHVKGIEKALLANHVPLYKRRRDQLCASLRAAWEKELILGSDLQAQQGWQMLAWLERHDRRGPTSGPKKADGGFAAELAGRSMAAMHRAASVGKHQATIDTHEAGRRLVDSAARAAQAVLQTPSTDIGSTADAYRQDEHRHGVRGAYRWRERNREFFPDAGQDGAVPARLAIDTLRARARACVDRYLTQPGVPLAVTLGRSDLESIKTALRTPHADDASELWLAGLQHRLHAQGRLVEVAAPFPLFAAAEPISPRSSAAAHAWRESHHARGARIEEHQRAMQIIARDMLALQGGRFGDILDPLGVIGASLAHNALAGQISRYYRVNHDLAFVAFTRGTARFAGQVFPVTLRGAATGALILAGGALAILQVSGPHLGDFRVEKLSPADAQELMAQGIHPAALQMKGIAPRVAGLAGPLAAGAMNVLQPQTNPFTFQSGGQIQSFRGAFVGGDPSFGSLVEAGAQDAPHFAGQTDPWSGEPADPGAVLGFLSTRAGATQLKLRIDRRLQALPDLADASAGDRMRWRDAQRRSREPWNARLGGFLPSRYFHDLSYGKNARKHFDQVQADRHRLATALVVAGHRLASLGAPAEPLMPSDPHPEVTTVADAMIRRLLLLPDVAAQLFVGSPPPGRDAQRAVLSQAAADNPWYLLRLLQFALSRLDPDDPAVDRAWLRQLHALRIRLTEDVLRTTVPQVERQLRHAIGLCGETPMPHGRWSELRELLERSQRDTESMAGGEARRHLRGLVAELADAVAGIDLVAF